MSLDSIAAAEAHNAEQRGHDDAEYVIGLLPGMLPLDIAAALMQGAGGRLWAAGYEAFFREETGFRVMYARRKPTSPAKGGPIGS